jgi:PPP family 3-phenylpropionic acid transporter
MPLVDNSVMNLLIGRKSEYSRIRLWGGVGWGVSATILGPILERAGLSWSFIGYLFFMGIMLIVAWQLPVAQERSPHSLRAGLHILLTNRNFLILLVVAVTQGMSLGVINTYLFLHLDALGASRTLMALSLTSATIAELFVWLIAARLLRKWGMAWMLALAMSGTAVRLFGYVWMPSPLWVLPISLLHAFTFAFFWAAGVAYADEIAPKGLSATAQTIFSGTAMGLGQTVGALVGGVIYQQYGVLATFSVMGGIEVVVLGGFLLLQQRELRARLAH